MFLSTLKAADERHRTSDDEREAFWEARELETMSQLAKWTERKYEWEAQARAWQNRAKAWTERDGLLADKQREWGAEQERLEKAVRCADLRRGAVGAKLEREKDRVRRRDDTVSFLRCKLALAEAGARQPGDLPASVARMEARHRHERQELEDQLGDAKGHRVRLEQINQQLSRGLTHEQEELENLERNSAISARLAEQKHAASLGKMAEEKMVLEGQLQDAEDRKRLFLAEWMKADAKISEHREDAARREAELRQSRAGNVQLRAALAKLNPHDVLPHNTDDAVRLRMVETPESLR